MCLFRCRGAPTLDFMTAGRDAVHKFIKERKKGGVGVWSLNDHFRVQGVNYNSERFGFALTLRGEILQQWSRFIVIRSKFAGRWRTFCERLEHLHHATYWTFVLLKFKLVLLQAACFQHMCCKVCVDLFRVLICHLCFHTRFRYIKLLVQSLPVKKVCIYQ